MRSSAVAVIAVCSALTALGVVLVLSRPHPHPLLTHVLANLLMIGGQVTISYAVGRFVGHAKATPRAQPEAHP